MSAWEENVRRVSPYTPGEQPGSDHIIKLNTNENPYPPSPKVAAALSEISYEELRRYPDPEITALREALSKRYGVRPSQVFVGVGSDDVLAMSFLTFFNSGRPVLFPDITYSFYDVWAEEFRIPYETRALDRDFRIRAEDYLAEDNGGIVLPNPNAPTGIAEPVSFFEEIIAKNPASVVIIDEAYVDFGAESVLPLIDRYDNLLLVQTFSKSRAMAGSRIGFAIGSERLIAYLSDVKFSFNSYTIDRITERLAVAALSDEAYFKEMTEQVIKTRERVKKELAALGFSFGDSQANFIFATHERVSARELFSALKAAGIYVRYFDKPRIDNHLRITIGTDAEMDALLSFLRDYLS